MAERRIHLASFVAGLLALTFAGLYLADASGGVDVDEYVIAAGALVVLGIAGVAVSLRTLLHGRAALRRERNAAAEGSVSAPR